MKSQRSGSIDSAVGAELTFPVASGITVDVLGFAVRARAGTGSQLLPVN